MKFGSLPILIRASIEHSTLRFVSAFAYTQELTLALFCRCVAVGVVNSYDMITGWYQQNKGGGDQCFNPYYSLDLYRINLHSVPFQ
jgi:hypothetical protein